MATVTMNRNEKNTKKQRKKRTVKPRKHAPKTVISVRISDEEKQRIDQIMRNGNIARYSDVLKIAIQMYPVTDNGNFTSSDIFH